MNLRTVMLAGLLLVTSCTDNTPRCSPDADVAGCLCRNGRLGSQRCGPDGLTLGACVCPPPDGGDPDAGVDVPSATEGTDAGSSSPQDSGPTTTDDLGAR